MEFNWENHKKHRDQVIADQGQWLGLLDENATPMMDLPPVMEMRMPEATNDPASGMVKLRVQSASGIVHPVIHQLIADGLGKTDDVGRLVPLSEATRFIAIERAGSRRVFRVDFAVAEGGAGAPSVLAVHGTDMLKLWRVFLRCQGRRHGQGSGRDSRGIGLVLKMLVSNLRNLGICKTSRWSRLQMVQLSRGQQSH